MLKYIFKKLLMMIPILLGLTIILFLILHLAPGDPVHLVVGPNVTPEVYENVRRSMGLDRPLIIQYFDYLSNLVKGDLGSSILQHRPVADIVLERFPITIGLGVRALLLSFLIAVPVGIIAAVNRKIGIEFSQTELDNLNRSLLKLSGIFMD